MFSKLLWFWSQQAMHTCHILLINTGFCVCLQCYYDVPTFGFLCG